MSARYLALALLASGCHEYTVDLAQVGTTPLPIALGSTVQMPVGIVLTVLPTGRVDGEVLEPGTPIELASDNGELLTVSPVAEAVDVWALVGVDIGQVFLLPEVDGREAVPIEVIVTAQPEL